MAILGILLRASGTAVGAYSWYKILYSFANKNYKGGIGWAIVGLVGSAAVFGSAAAVDPKRTGISLGTSQIPVLVFDSE